MSAIKTRMNKNFDAWNEDKKKHDKNEIGIYFYEREVWWCAIGINVGFEQDGKGGQFSRPVLVIRKFSKNVFLGVPLTTSQKEGKYYYSFPFLGATSTALLSQVRLFDSKRLLLKMGTVPEKILEEVRERVRAIV